MSAIIIRAAQAEDIDTIQAFIRALADYERLAHEVKADRETLGRYLFGPRPMAEVLIAEADGSAVGFALFFHNFSTFEGRPGLYLEDLFVEESQRGRGIGRRLIDDLIAMGKRDGWTNLYWHTNAENAQARRLYDSYDKADGFVRYRLPLRK